MQALRFDKIRTILCLGAHSDDLEIGCGGALMKLLAERPDLHVQWVVFGATGQRADEARASAEALLASAASMRIELLAFTDTCFPFLGMEIKEQFRRLQNEASPDLIFTHRLEDRHQDHRLLAELTWNSFRDHLILEYEIPKYEGDLGQPNCFVRVSEDLCRRKCEHLMQYFPSQLQKPWFTADAFQALMRLRGIECNSPSGFAEGFCCRKFVME
ncbi:MAG: PIG-L family deacetylase [Pirellulales bacterium]|nr:PIG-L family deacetylase [Pirellulales bacterium]